MYVLHELAVLSPSTKTVRDARRYVAARALAEALLDADRPVLGARVLGLCATTCRVGGGADFREEVKPYLSLFDPSTQYLTSAIGRYPTADSCELILFHLPHPLVLGAVSAAAACGSRSAREGQRLRWPVRGAAGRLGAE